LLARLRLLLLLFLQPTDELLLKESLLIQKKLYSHGFRIGLLYKALYLLLSQAGKTGYYINIPTTRTRPGIPVSLQKLSIFGSKPKSNIQAVNSACILVKGRGSAIARLLEVLA
jgi:hypothetical protein